MRSIKVIHYGVAHDHSAGILECVRRHPEAFEVVGLVEPDEDMRRAFGGDPVYAGLPWLTEAQAFARPDIEAAICEGHELRSLRDAQSCIRRGLHVHLDKPAGVDLAAFAQLLEDAQRKSLTLHMGYMYRYNPAMQYVVKQARAGRLGCITGIDGSFSIRHDAQKRAWMGQFPGGMMFFLGCHVIDMILSINGKPEQVMPFLHSSDVENEGSLDSAFAVLDYPHGACSVRANATEANGFKQRHLLVCGSEGTLRIEPLENPTRLRQVVYDPAHRLDDAGRDVPLPEVGGRYDAMMLEFAACVRGEMANPYTPAYELMLQQTVLQACGVISGDEA